MIYVQNILIECIAHPGDRVWTQRCVQPSGHVQAEAKGGIVLKMKTGPQSNGYVKDILTSPNLTEQSATLAEKIYGVKSEESDKK